MKNGQHMKHIKFLAVMALPLFLAACGGGSSPRSGTTLTDGTSLGGTSDTGTTTTDTAGLFDTDLSGDAASTSGSSLGGLTSTESQCLSGTSTSTSTSSSFSGSLACLSESASASGSISDQAFFQAGIASLGQLGECQKLVAQVKPRAGASQEQVSQAFDLAKLAMIRCVRRLVRQQANFLPWNQSTQNAYQYNDNVLWGLLQNYAQ